MRTTPTGRANTCGDDSGGAGDTLLGKELFSDAVQFALAVVAAVVGQIWLICPPLIVTVW